jgi:hypothetical protein
MGLRNLHPDWAPERQAAYRLVRSLIFYESEGSPREPGSSALNDVWQSYDKLAALYRPHHQLPMPGQRLWRQLADALEQLEVEALDLVNAMDEFRQWLVDQYDLDDSSKTGRQSPCPQLANTDVPHQARWADTLNEAQRAIMEVIGETPMLGKDIAVKAGYEHDTVRRHLAFLVKLGAIKKHGSGRGYYK